MLISGNQAMKKATLAALAMGLRVGPKSSLTQTNASEHETKRGEAEKSECVSGEIFEILGQAATAIEPREGALDNPASRQKLKPFGVIGAFDSCGGFRNRHLSDSPWQTAFERFAMSTPVPLRSDFDTIGLRMLARRSRDPDQTRRLLALAEIYDGGSRPDAARIGGVGVQIVRDWVVRFNAKGPDGLLTGKAPGAPSILDERQRQALRQVV